jgi:hypothetical protein
VRTSIPVSVTRRVSSNWAEFWPSFVAAVHCGEEESAREKGEERKEGKK